MAEEAMRSIAAKYFKFDEDGSHVPYQKPQPLAPESLDDEDLAPHSGTMAPDQDQPTHVSIVTEIFAREIMNNPHDGVDPNVIRILAARSQVATGQPAILDQPHGPSEPLNAGKSAAPVATPSSAPAPVSGGSGASSGQVTVGLGLVVNGKTYPKIEAGRERWYSQRPDQGNSYSRYSDLVSHDKAKGLTPMPRASKDELSAARRQRTFG